MTATIHATPVMRTSGAAAGAGAAVAGVAVLAVAAPSSAPLSVSSCGSAMTPSAAVVRYRHNSGYLARSVARAVRVHHQPTTME